MFIVLLIINALVEGSVAVMMLYFPETFFPEPDPALFNLAKSFGVGASAITILSLILIRFRKSREAVMMGCTVLAFYHTGIAVLQVINPMQGMPAWVAPTFHGLLVAGFVYYGVTAWRKTAIG